MCVCDPPSEIHPDGLPHSYTIILMLRLLPDSPTEAFDVWQVSSKDQRPETGVTVDRKSCSNHGSAEDDGDDEGDGVMVWCLLVIYSASSQTVSFYNQDERGGIQRVTFDSDQVKSIFHGSFHKVRPSDVPPAGWTFRCSSCWMDGDLL